MSHFTITIGDHYHDGHGRTITYTIEIPGQFTSQILQENYQNNVSQWGFSPAELVNDSGSTLIETSHAYKLLGIGLNSEFLEAEIQWDELGDEKETEYYSFEGGTDGLLDMCMLFVGHGLDNFTWETASAPLSLFGSSDALLEDTIGYGLF